jgi:hypothetical protein
VSSPADTQDAQLSLVEFFEGRSESGPQYSTEQQSYRDAVRFLVVFTAARAHKKADELLTPDIDADRKRPKVPS